MKISASISAWVLIIFIILFILLFLVVSLHYLTKNDCFNADNMAECIIQSFLASKDDQKNVEGTVLATGTLSREDKGSKYAVNIQLNVPLEGGAVTGNFSGDCSGKITGDFTGGDKGTISGSASGNCGFILPASAQFYGSLNKQTKTINLSGTGSVAVFSGSGSVVLSY